MFDMLEGVFEIFGELILDLLARGLIEVVNQIGEVFR